jgi:hypothetical protein
MSLKSILALSPKNNLQMPLVGKVFFVINVFLVSVFLIEDNLQAQASNLNEPQMPISTEQNSNGEDRLVAILIDNSTDSLPVPGSYVDVKWVFAQDGKKKIASPLIRFAKVMSVRKDESTKNKEQINNQVKHEVSLLVTPRQSQFIEVARGSGEFSLVLLNTAEVPTNRDEDAPKILDLDGVAKDGNADVGWGIGHSDPEVDPVTGRKIKYILKNGRWIVDKDNKNNF